MKSLLALIVIQITTSVSLQTFANEQDESIHQSLAPSYTKILAKSVAPVAAVFSGIKLVVNEKNFLSTADLPSELKDKLVKTTFEREQAEKRYLFWNNQFLSAESVASRVNELRKENLVAMKLRDFEEMSAISNEVSLLDNKISASLLFQGVMLSREEISNIQEIAKNEFHLAKTRAKMAQNEAISWLDANDSTFHRLFGVKTSEKYRVRLKSSGIAAGVFGVSLVITAKEVVDTTKEVVEQSKAN